jgi:serine protease Do
MRFSILSIILVAAPVISPNLAPAQSLSSRLQQGLMQVQASASDLEHSLRLVADPRSRAYLGVQLVDVNADRAQALKLDEERGVEVVKVEPGSPAESAGIHTGDVLLSYNGETILGAQQLGRLVGETPLGRKVRIQFWREGKAEITTATIAQAPWRKMVPGDFAIPMPDLDLHMLDIPDPLLVWKNRALGIEAEPVDGQLAEYFGVKRGVLVRSVENGSAADKAGLRSGDVLTAVADHPVTTPREVMSSLRSQRRPGKPIPVALVREHKELTVNVMPESENPQ